MWAPADFRKGSGGSWEKKKKKQQKKPAIQII